MNFLYFHQHFSTPSGSTGTRSYEMAKRLIAHGHSVTMVCGSAKLGNTGLVGPFVNGRREGVVDSIRVIELELAYSNSLGFLKRALLFLQFAWRSVKVAFSERYDVLFATTTPLTAGIPGIAARWLRGKPFVFEVRDLWPELPKAMGVITNPVLIAMMSLLEWASYRSATRLVGLSPGIVVGIAKRGIPESRIALVPNGCDLAIFSECAEPWRPDGVADSDLMAVFTGAHGMANGLGAVLDAAAVIKRMGRKDIKIVLIGDGMLKPALQQRASKEGLDNVIFHQPVSKHKLAGLMASADIGLQILANVPAFYFGTSPNKFFDYIASGLPVLNNYPGWLSEMISVNGIGYAVPPDDAEVFALALVHAAGHRDQLKTMGTKAKEFAQAQFNRDLLADRFVTWLEGAGR
jgi:glycosyltransferase involved in cell wall biosynthesis